MYENNIYSGAGAGSNTSGANENGSAYDSYGVSSAGNANGAPNTNGAYGAGGVYGASGTNYANSVNGGDNGYSANGYGANSYGAGGFNGGSQYGGQDGFNATGESPYSTYQTAEPDSGKPDKDHKEKKGGYFRKAMLSVSLGLFFGLFAGIGFFAVKQTTDLAAPSGDDKTVISGNVENQGTNTASAESESGIKLTDTSSIRVVSSDVTDVVDEVMPAMVSIVNNFTATQTDIFGQSYRQDAAASGSGIIVAESDKELLMVTNHHVVADATKLDVTFIDGSQAEAQIKGMDSDMDLAVIAIPLDKLSEETKSAIAIAMLGDSDSLKMGEPVIAIGNALGYGQSVTNGIVSALNRQITLEDGSMGTFIQTNAAINPGNSGGALLNVNGEVIGINSSKIGGSVVEGMGYAIPISAAKPIIADLMLKETRSKVEDGQVGYMGITMQKITDQFAQLYNMPQGIYVTGVEEGSPAQQAGILTGDIIVNFDGEKITSYEDLQGILQYYAAGTTAKVTVKRPMNGQYEAIELTITLGTKPAQSN